MHLVPEGQRSQLKVPLDLAGKDRNSLMPMAPQELPASWMAQ